MPYITPERRIDLDPYIEKLQQSLSELGLTAGDLNYVITRLVAFYFKKERRYKTIALVSGVLEDVKSEFDRRLAVPYENSVHERNGDIPEFLTAFRN